MRKPPMSLVVGLAIGLLGLLAVVAMRLVDDVPSVQRLGLLAQGAWFAERILVTAGLFALAARATGRTRSALRVAAWCMTIAVVWNFARPLVLVGRNYDWFGEVLRWGFAAYGAGMLASAIALVVAARGLSRARLASILVVVALLAYGWIPYVFEDLYAWLFENHYNDVYYLATGLVIAFAYYVLAKLVENDLAEPAADAPAAAGGFRMIALGLQLRVVVAILFAFAGAGLVATPKLALVIGGPFVVAATMCVAAIGMHRVAAASVEHLSSKRLAIAAGLTLWWCGMQLEQVATFYNVLVDPWGDRNPVVPMAIFGPLMVIVAIAVVGSAIGQLAIARNFGTLREATAIRTVMFVMLAIVAIVIQTNFEKAVRPASYIALTFVAALTMIGALVSFAGVAKQAAVALDESASLPTARIKT